MNEKQYDRLVNLCVHGLRITMLVVAVFIPILCTVDASILNKMFGKRIASPHVYYLYELIYGEVILGYLLAMFLNFKNKEIFTEETSLYLKRVGELIFFKDFIYIPINLMANQTLTINFNITAWMIGYILILFSNLLQPLMLPSEAQSDPT